MTLEEAGKITNKDIADYLGGLPEQKMHCSVMGREALEAAIENYNGGGDEERQLQGKVVCTCFGVTEDEIRRVVSENNLTEVEQVTNYCKAGGGCGGCIEQIQKIIEEVNPEAVKSKPAPIEEKPKNLTNIKKIQLIGQTINEQIRPALRADGGDIELIDVENNKVIVAFRGMCAQCKMAEVTIKDVVQAKLREFVSDDITVEEDKDSKEQEHQHREGGK